MAQQSRETEPYYEVDLREYIQVIWREKWIILLVFLIAAGAAYGFSQTRPPQYNTQTTLLVTPRVSKQLVKNKNGGLSSSTLPVNVYRKSAMAEDLLQKIIKDLGLTNKEGRDITLGTLEEKLKVNIELSKQEGAQSLKLPLVTMTVTGKDPNKIKRIANKWADLFVEKNTELLSSETARSYEFISSRFSEVRKKLTAKEGEKLDYKKKHPLKVLKSEVQVLQWKYKDFLSQLKSKRADLAEKKARLKSLNRLLEKEPKFLELKRSIPEKNLWNLLSGFQEGEKKTNSDQLKGLTDLKIKDQEKNEIYFDLKKEKREVQADIDSLGKTIEYLKKKTQQISKEIERKQFEIDSAELQLKQLDRKISRLSDTYKTLSGNLEEARIAKAEKESSIRIMERAVAPGSSVGTNTRQNVAVAGVLGLFIGVLVAFFKNYMEGYEESEDEGEGDEENENSDSE